MTTAIRTVCVRVGSPGANVPPGSFVTTAEAQRVANAIGARAYKECSALKIEVRVCAVHAWTPC